MKNPEVITNCAQESVPDLRSSIILDVLNSLSSHIALLDSNGVIVEVNKSWRLFADINGLASPDYGIGTNYIDVSENAEGEFSEFGKRLAIAIRQVIAGNIAYFSLDYPCHSPSEKHWYKVIVTPMKNEKFSGAVVSHRDISDFILSSEELRRSEENFRSLFEQASDGIFIADAEMNIIHANHSASSQLGYSIEELQELNVSELFFSADLVKEPIKMKELNRGESVINERIFRRKDGSALYVEINSKRLPNGNYQGIARDISERRLNELLIAKKQNYINTILNTDPECIKLLTEDGICLTINSAGIQILETDSEKMLIGHPIIGHIKKQYHDQVYKLVQDVFNGIPSEFEYELITFKGNIRWMEARVVPFKDINGKIESCLWISRDISEKVKDKLALQKSHTRLKKNFSKIQNIVEKERKEISRELHDELGQKLTGLSLDIAWLQKRIKPELKEEINLMNEMLGLVGSLMSTVQDISKSLRPPILEYFNLTDAVDWLVADFVKRSKVKTKVKIELNNIELNENLKVTVFRILQESLTNIIRHSGADTVLIDLHESGGQIHLSVKDNGKGILWDEVNDLNSFGIHGMQERVESIKGKFIITGVPGKGTKVLTSIPIPVQK